MPRLSIWAIRAALCHLGLGFLLGAAMLAARGLPQPAGVIRLRPLHIEVLLIGWIVQLTFGVAYWILPRRPGSERGDERLAWGALLLLNLGVLITGLGSILTAPTEVLVAGRTAELLAALAFAGHAWPRVRAYSARTVSS